jgi:hypothetical protein
MNHEPRYKMKKQDTLKQWQKLPENLPIMPHFRAIPYKATGSKYGACGIRIDGSPEFVDAVLSRLKDLIDGENHLTRLGLARNKVDGSTLGKSFSNQETGAECCYIRLHERGNEGKIASAIFDKHLGASTKRYMERGVA